MAKIKFNAPPKSALNDVSKVYKTIIVDNRKHRKYKFGLLFSIIVNVILVSVLVINNLG